MRLGDSETLKAYVQKVIFSFTPSSTSFENINIIRVDFIMTGIMFMQENKTALRDIFDKYFDPLTEIAEKDDPLDCIAFIQYFYDTMLTYTHSNKISSGKKIVEKCMELVEQNISNPELSVKWLASQFYMNENYLSRQFHSETALPLIKYINQQRLEKAKSYLDEGFHNLQTVAKMIGFSDPLYFSKCFKKKFGVAPSVYLGKISHKSP